MPGPYVFDRVKDTTTTTGTGTLTLANSAPSGFRTFGSVLANNDTCFYAIAHQSASEWEVGIGTYTVSGTTLARTQVLASSNSGSAVNLSAGTKDVFITVPGSQMDWLPVLTPPVNGDFAWINQGGATVTAQKGGIYLSAPSSSLNNLRIRKKSAPSAPYTITAHFLPLIWPTDFNECGLCWRQSSDGKIIAMGLLNEIASSGPAMLYLRKYTDASTFSATYTNIKLGNLFGPGLWFRLQDDNTNRKVLISADGLNWMEVHSVGRTDFMTADEVGFYCNANSTAGPVSMLLTSWKQG